MTNKKKIRREKKEWNKFGTGFYLYVSLPQKEKFKKKPEIIHEKKTNDSINVVKK